MAVARRHRITGDLLGDELWDFVRVDRESDRRSGPGLPLDRAARFLDALEAV